MAYILKNTSGLVNTRVTDAARQKMSQGSFNISYFQVGDSEVSYNTLPNTYNQSLTNILEPNFVKFSVDLKNIIIFSHFKI